jgi:DNA-binding CsgD family transcriptional regulator
MDAVIGSVRCPLLIGRDELLELADRRLDNVLAGQGHFLLVAGEAGIGKSRFMEAVERMALERGFTAIWGHVAPQDRDLPAASILDLARTMTRVAGYERLGADLLALRDATLDAEQARRRHLVLDVVDALLGGVQEPILLGFEDLQWTDDLSREIIADLARRSRDRRILLCAGYRSDEAPAGTSLRDWRSRLLTQRLAEEVRLTPLDEAQTALVTTLILDTGLPAPREVAAAVYERTDGIPLHIEEVLGALGAEARANGTAIREATVPDTIEDAVLARLGFRSEEAQALARAGAVVGRCFTPEVLAGIIDWPPEAIDGPLDELVAHGILWPPGPRGTWDFRHQLLRDAIYRSVPMRDRRRFHARAGEFGAELEGQSLVHSSLHFERAGMRRQAFETALAGARDAARLTAHREAFELYRRAVANVPADLGLVERGAILVEYCTEAMAVEENEIGRQAASEAAEAFDAANEGLRAVDALTLVTNIQRREAEPVSERLAMLDRLDESLAAAPDDPEAARLRGEVLYFRGAAELDRGDLAAAARHFEASGAIATEAGYDELKLAVDWKIGHVDVALGQVERGLTRIGTIALDAERAGDETTGVSAFRDAAQLSAEVMDYAAAMRWVDRGVRYADSIEQSYCAHIMKATSALAAWAMADWAAAIARGSQAVADRGCRRGAEMARTALGYVALGRGDHDAARQALAEALELGIRSEAQDLTLPPLWGLAEVDTLVGEPEGAWARCQEALLSVGRTGHLALLVPFVVTGVRAAQLAGRPADAASWLAACTDLLEPIAEVAGPALEHGRGLIALADGATGVARAALEEAVNGWDAKGRVWEATWARLDLAASHVRAGRFGEALPLAVEARATASRLESRPLADRADALQRMARGHVSVEEPWRPLTAREFAVARLVAEGRTNSEIADTLGIAPKTASSHIEHILAKLGASRRTEIATWASSVERSPIVH